MATYAELWTLLEDPQLKEKVAAACLHVSQDILDEPDSTTNHANRLKWAKDVFRNPVQAGDDMLKAVLAANTDASVATIQGAADAIIKTAVAAAVDIFADGT